MVSPGPAKGGEEFSAHFKQAYDPPKGNPDAGKPALSPNEPPPAGGKEVSASPKPAAPAPKKTSADGPSPAPSKNADPSDPVKPAAETPPAASGEPAVLPQAQDPAPILSAPVMDLLATPVKPVDPAPKKEGETVVPTAEPPLGLLAPAVLPSEAVEDPVPDAAADVPSPSEKKTGKDNEKAADVPAPVQINVMAILPVPIEAVPEASVAASPVPADGGSIAPIGAAGTEPTAAKPLAAEAIPPANVPADSGPAPKPERSAATQSKAPKEKNISEKAPVSVASDGAAQKKPDADQPLRALAPSAPKPTPLSHADPSPRRAETDARKDAPPMKTDPRPDPVLPSAIVPRDTGPLEALPKPKAAASDAVAPVTASRPAVPAGAESIIFPSIDGTPAVSTPAAAPAVLTPSPVDLARQIHVHLESGRSVVRIDLHPDHLGELRISLETKGKDVSMQFTVDNDNARQSVVAGLREITGTLSTLGWSVTGLAVHVSSGGVGNGRGETGGPLWTAPAGSNVVPSEPEPGAAPAAAGQWRVDLVA